MVVKIIICEWGIRRKTRIFPNLSVFSPTEGWNRRNNLLDHVVSCILRGNLGMARSSCSNWLDFRLRYCDGNYPSHEGRNESCIHVECFKEKSIFKISIRRIMKQSVKTLPGYRRSKSFRRLLKRRGKDDFYLVHDSWFTEFLHSRLQ